MALALSKELQRMTGEADESLLDYLLLLAESGRNQSDIANDLIDFCSNESEAQQLARTITRLHKEAQDREVATQKEEKNGASTQQAASSKTRQVISLKRSRDESASIATPVSTASTSSASSTRVIASSPSASPPSSFTSASGSTSTSTSTSTPSSRSAPRVSVIASSTRRRPDQQRFVPGQKLSVTRSMDGSRTATEASSSARVTRAQTQERTRKTAQPTSVVLVQKREAPHTDAETIDPVSPDTQPPAAKRARTSNGAFRITVSAGGERRAATGGNDNAAAQATAAPTAHAVAETGDKPKKRLIITKAGKQVTPEPSTVAATATTADAPPATQSTLVTMGKKRQFSSGFSSSPAAPTTHAHAHARAPAPAPSRPQPTAVDEPPHSQPLAVPEPAADEDAMDEDMSGEIQQSALTAHAPSAFTAQPQHPSAFTSGVYNPAVKSTIKCRFFPACTNPNCPYLHPTTLCPAFPHCMLGDACPHLHPAVPCRYGEKCTNPHCAFTHPPSMAAGRGGRGGGPALRGGRGGMRGGRGGSVTSATSMTPSMDSALSAPSMRGRGGRRGGLTHSLKIANTPCRYGNACTREDCVYKHPDSAMVRVTPSASSTTPDLTAPFNAGQQADTQSQQQPSAFSQPYTSAFSQAL